MPLALQGEDATVTVVHSKTANAQAICVEADILIAAIGKPKMVKADWVKPGAAVIDVGTNPIPVSHTTTLIIVSMKEWVLMPLTGGRLFSPFQHPEKQ